MLVLACLSALLGVIMLVCCGLFTYALCSAPEPENKDDVRFGCSPSFLGVLVPYSTIGERERVVRRNLLECVWCVIAPLALALVVLPFMGL